MSENETQEKKEKINKKRIAGPAGFAGVQLGNDQLHHGCSVSQ